MCGGVCVPDQLFRATKIDRHGMPAGGPDQSVSVSEQSQATYHVREVGRRKNHFPN